MTQVGAIRRMLCVAAAVGLAAAAGCSMPTRACGRFFTDVAVVVLSPVNLPIGAVVDSLRDSSGGGLAALPAFPLVLTANVIKHAYATAVYGGDLLLTPVHLVINSRPMRLYDMSGIPFRVRRGKLSRGADRATYSAHEIFARSFGLVGDVGEAAVDAADRANSLYGIVLAVSYRTTIRLVRNTAIIGLYTLDYAVSPIYMPFGPGRLKL